MRGPVRWRLRLASSNVDQTTVGRRIASLEEQVGTKLFARSSSGYSMTAAGRRLIEAAEAMASAASEFDAQSLADDDRMSGTVQVATSETLAERFVVPAAADVHAAHPAINVVVRTGWTPVNLSRREADIAVRLVKPTDPRLAARRVGNFAMRLYASPEYVGLRGAPRNSLSGHDLIAYEEAVRESSRDGARPPFAGAPVDGARMAFQGNSAAVLVRAAEQGLGVVELPSYVGDERDTLQRVLPGFETPYAVWMVVHRDARQGARVRAVCDAVVARFRGQSRRRA